VDRQGVHRIQFADRNVLKSVISRPRAFNPRFKRDNAFYRVREGDLFFGYFRPARKARYQKVGWRRCAKDPLRPFVIKAIAAKDAGYGRSQPLLVRRGK